MKVAEYISLYNTDAVVDYANSLGYEIPNNPNAAFEFLKLQYEQNPIKTKLALQKLHPHLEALGILKKDCGCGCNKKKSFRNMADDEIDEYIEESVALMERGYNKGKNIISDTLNGKDHTNEILKFGAVFLAGVFIGKFLMR